MWRDVIIAPRAVVWSIISFHRDFYNPKKIRKQIGKTFFHSLSILLFNFLHNSRDALRLNGSLNEPAYEIMGLIT